MSVQHIHTFLVRPGKGTNRDKVDLNGAEVPLTGGMLNLLGGVYDKSVYECDIDITFRPTRDGKQQNECRDLILAYLQDPELDTAKPIANRLRDYTDGRSGLGLLFLIAGQEGANRKIVISRFPTDSAVAADEDALALKVQFLERVFMKNKTSYKAVVYQDGSLQAGFWNGRAVDKQLIPGQSSDYWISDFLSSEFASTPSAGTRRLANALREATQRAPLEVKQELTAAATLAEGLDGKTVSIQTFGDQFPLSDAAKEALVRAAKTARAAQERFQFDAREFRNRIAYKSVILDNGAILTAESGDFDDVFKKRYLDSTRDRVEFTTQGKIINERLKVAQ